VVLKGIKGSKREHRNRKREKERDRVREREEEEDNYLMNYKWTK
jgi:hypothetical protein